MSNHPRQTLIYSPTFRWNGDLLEQEVQIIQHYPEHDRDVGIFREWHSVKIDGKEYRHPTRSRTIFPEVPGWEKPAPRSKPDTSYLDKVVPVKRGVSHAKSSKPLRCDHPTWPDTNGVVSLPLPRDYMTPSPSIPPSPLTTVVPEGYTLIEFDGGTSCNIPAQGYGEGYGSFQIDHGTIHRVTFGRGHSSNASEILTLAAALEHLYSRGGADSVKLFIRGDSQIALKWATDKSNPKAKTSECFKQAIARVRLFNHLFADIKTEWRGRRHSVKLFGH
jgi:hypothetical protein